MPYITGISFIVLILNFILGIAVFSKNRRDIVNRLFFAITISICIWIGGLQLITPQLQTTVSSLPVFGLRLAFAGGTLIAFFFSLLAIYFPRKTIVPPKFFVIALAITTFFLVSASIFTDLIVADINVIKTLGYQADYGPLYYFFGIFFITVMGGGIYYLFRKRQKMEGIERIQLHYFLIGSTLSVVLATLTNLFFPLVIGTSAYSKLGPLFTIFLVGFTFYAILKHHLMNVRVIGTEIFTVLIIAIFLLQIFYAGSTAEFGIRVVFFSFAAFFGYFLVRGTLREVETLRRLSESKTEFISVASHQLRSPLTTIKGYVSMLLEGGFASSPAESRQVLDRVYKSNERLIRLINELLDISRIEEGRFEFTMESLPFIPFISDIADELQGAVDKSRLSLAFINSGNEKYAVWADSEKLRQVFQNLIDNAIRYTPNGEIKVSCYVRGKNIITAVKDTGIGMSKEDSARIFERFSRGKGSSRYHTEGAGLGLYIARKIVEAHKGKIWAESEGSGKGSTFYVELPLKI